MKAGLSADHISFLGIIVAVIGAWALVEAPRQPWLFLAAAACVQLRLLANLLDGMVAVEGGRGGPTGAIWNEFPDRIEDSLFLIAAGYAADPLAGLIVGLLAALLAAICAYVRLLGATLGQPQDFGGPMAKPHRMAALTGGLVAAFVARMLTGNPYGSPWLMLALAIIAGGTLLTIALRLNRLSKALRG
ncbi:MAG TPA: CDP-alcohol phosphatidyltransferase family protein [Sphingomicrobium sp.]|nr:CDP-alcohol phosphatidyltransferase family protein [Sphingomicrobium sp.]